MSKHRLSDAELVCTQLLVADPYSDGGLLLARLPDGVTITDVINEHSYEKYPRDKAFCCVCGARLHKHGFRVKRSDGLETLLGSCCAKPLLIGRDWRKHANEHAERRRRQACLREIYAIRGSVLKSAAQLVSWQLLADDLHAAHLKFRGAMPEAFDLISRAANSGLELEASEMIRRVDLSDRGSSNSDAVEKFVTEHLSVRIGISGRPFLFADPRSRPKLMSDAISRFSAVSHNTDAHRTTVLSSVVRRMRRALEDLQVLEDMRVAAANFFSPENLAGIARWARLLRSGHDQRLPYDLAVEGRALVNLANDRRVSEPRLRSANSELLKSLTYFRRA